MQVVKRSSQVLHISRKTACWFGFGVVRCGAGVRAWYMRCAGMSSINHENIYNLHTLYWWVGARQLRNTWVVTDIMRYRWGLTDKVAIHGELFIKYLTEYEKLIHQFWKHHVWPAENRFRWLCLVGCPKRQNGGLNAKVKRFIKVFAGHRWYMQFVENYIARL